MSAERRSPWWENTSDHEYVPVGRIGGRSWWWYGNEPKPYPEDRVRRMRLSATLYQLAQAGELDEDLAWMFPTAARGGDIERDFARYVDALLKRTLRILLVVVLGIAGAVWLLMKVWM